MGSSGDVGYGSGRMYNRRLLVNHCYWFLVDNCYGFLIDDWLVVQSMNRLSVNSLVRQLWNNVLDKYCRGRRLNVVMANRQTDVGLDRMGCADFCD